MNRTDLINNLTAALAASVNSDPAVAAALKAFAATGQHVLEMNIQISVSFAPGETAAPSSDEEFLRKLRIEPNLSFSEGN